MTEEKRCSKCGREFPATAEFWDKNKLCKDGLRGVCKICTGEQKKRYARQHSKAVAKYQRQWKQNNAEHMRNYRLLRNYGITLEEYDAILEEQKGVCAICGKPPRHGNVLNVDHDHDTGVVRGLLHSRCNTAIGLLGEDIETVLKAASYLAKHR